MVHNNGSTNSNEGSLATQAWENSEGNKLAYYDSKPGEGNLALLLLHGFCGSSAYWERVLPLIAPSIRTIVPDLRGHGRSGASSDEVYSMELFSEDIHGLLAELGIEKAIVLGHSLGGYITLAFAQRYAAQLAGFGLIHSTSYADTEQAKAGRVEAANRLLAEGIQPFVDGLAPKLFAPAHLASMAGEVEQVRQIGYRTSAAGAAATALGMRERPERHHVLQQAKVPVLLIAGENDGVVPPEKTLIELPVPARAVLLENCGHMGMLEAPEQLAAEITHFIGVVTY